jgi:hypothetical protein
MLVDGSDSHIPGSGWRVILDSMIAYRNLARVGCYRTSEKQHDLLVWNMINRPL